MCRALAAIAHCKRHIYLFTPGEISRGAAFNTESTMDSGRTFPGKRARSDESDWLLAGAAFQDNDELTLVCAAWDMIEYETFIRSGAVNEAIGEITCELSTASPRHISGPEEAFSDYSPPSPCSDCTLSPEKRPKTSMTPVATVQASPPSPQQLATLTTPATASAAPEASTMTRSEWASVVLTPTSASKDAHSLTDAGQAPSPFRPRILFRGKATSSHIGVATRRWPQPCAMPAQLDSRSVGMAKALGVAFDTGDTSPYDADSEHDSDEEL